MKKNLIFLCYLLTLPLFSVGQHPDIQNFYHKYSGYENSTDIDVNSWLIKMTSTMSGDETTQKVLDKITYLRVLLMDNGNVIEKKD